MITMYTVINRPIILSLSRLLEFFHISTIFEQISKSQRLSSANVVNIAKNVERKMAINL